MKWLLPNEKHQSSKLVDFILNQRGIEDQKKYLNPKIEDLNDPVSVYGAKDAAEVIMKAVKDGKKIFIHGDFDVDGVTATTIMWDFLYRKLGADVSPYVPSRFSDGYGLSEESVTTLIDQGAEMIITVDCGIKDVDIVKKYSDKIDFVITDHHTLLSSEYEDKNKASKVVGDYRISKYAKAVVHPRIDSSYVFPEICGAVVSWKTCCAINQVFGLGFDMNQYLELAAMGTICDVMPLVDENRVIVHFGLEQLRKTKNPGLNALISNADIKKHEITTYHIGFIIGPRINAAGRIDHALDAVRLLSTESSVQAQELATKLNLLNQQRQDLTRHYITIAEEMISKIKDNLVYVIYGDDWPEGIIGLIAGSLSHSYSRPVLVATRQGDIIKGSARSIENFNIAEALRSLDSILERHGGHAQAAGFQLKSDMIEEFIKSLNALVFQQLTNESLIPVLHIDSVIEIDEIDIDLFEEIQKLEPFGQLNSEPTLALMDVSAEKVSTVGKDKQHMKFELTHNNKKVDAIAFNSAKKFLPILSSEKSVSVAFKLLKNTWNGKTKIQVRVIDVKNSSEVNTNY